MAYTHVPAQDRLNIYTAAPSEIVARLRAGKDAELSKALLGALDLRRRNPELISCPTCGRCQVDLIGLAQEVERRIACLDKPVKVAVMGCVVNGPGEAADADIGVACGKGVGVVFRHGQTVRKVEEGAIVDALLEEIKDL